MDTTKEFTAVEWCAGYGGIHLGLKRAIRNLRVIAYGEIEAFACANLVSKMEAGLLDAAPIWTDIKTFPCTEFRDRVDLLVAGYPCQPFSAAGKRLGTEDPRHLWPHIARAIRVIRPRLCFFENVEGHISLGLREVVGELEQIGYSTAWGIFSAAEVGAPHQRKRVFILAYCHNARQLQHALRFSGGEEYASTGSCGAWPARPGEPQHGWESPRVVGNAPQREDHGLLNPSVSVGSSGGPDGEAMGDAQSVRVEGRQHDNTSSNRSGGSPQQLSGASGRLSECRQTQPPLGRDADGTAGGMDYAELQVSCDNRTDELRLLGNGVVPATAERAFRILIEELMGGQNHGR